MANIITKITSIFKKKKKVEEKPAEPARKTGPLYQYRTKK